MKNNLSVLKNSVKGTTTYYVGDNIEHVRHLNNCTLICKPDFSPALENVELIQVDDPQLYFYKLSHSVEWPYTFEISNKGIVPKTGANCDIHPSAIIGDNVLIGDNVTIGPNTVVYSKTKIGNNTRIDANCTIGSEGMMWVWDEEGNKIFLRQLGRVEIGMNCIIGSNSVVVRGSANELTIICDGVNMAPGCLIGHGSYIGKNTHFANNVSTGGSSSVSAYSFLGTGAIILPGIKIEADDVILGSGSTLTRNVTVSGVYVGSPAKKIKETSGKLNGVPKWRT